MVDLAQGPDLHVDTLVWHGNRTSIRAMKDVAEERRRQFESEGFVTTCDDDYTNNELAVAAACYALGKHEIVTNNVPRFSVGLWPWAFSWWKPTTYRRNLVKAGALIIAEIERLDRAEAAVE